MLNPAPAGLGEEKTKREEVSYLNFTVFCAVQARLKALLEKHF